jgi:excisionase family DNA binding protein
MIAGMNFLTRIHLPIPSTAYKTITNNTQRESLVIMSTDPNLQMLTPQEVAEILGIHQKTVHLWLRTGKLEGVKLSYRSWRIPKAALKAFIDQRRNVNLTDADIPAGQLTAEKKDQPVQNPGIAEERVPGRATMKGYIRDIMGEGTRNDHP